MLNQGRPLLRAERSGARKGKGDSREWTAPGPGFWGFGEAWWHMLFLCWWLQYPPWAWFHCQDGEWAERTPLIIGWEGEPHSPGGDKDHERRTFWTNDHLLCKQGIMIRNMSGANTTLFWSVKSLWSGMERMRNGGWQSLSGSEDKDQWFDWSGACGTEREWLMPRLGLHLGFK